MILSKVMIVSIDFDLIDLIDMIDVMLEIINLMQNICSS
jgi:hypothetical protein